MLDMHCNNKKVTRQVQDNMCHCFVTAPQNKFSPSHILAAKYGPQFKIFKKQLEEPVCGMLLAQHCHG